MINYPSFFSEAAQINALMMLMSSQERMAAIELEKIEIQDHSFSFCGEG